jgi:hypothetical protein
MPDNPRDRTSLRTLASRLFKRREPRRDREIMCIDAPVSYLRDELISLTDNRCGDFVMNRVGQALSSFEDIFSSAPQSVVFPEGSFSVTLIAARVAHSLLDRVSQFVLDEQSDLEQWSKLFSLRQLLWRTAVVHHPRFFTQ